MFLLKFLILCPPQLLLSRTGARTQPLVRKGRVPFLFHCVIKQFYLYVTQTIDRSKAVIGGTRISPAKVAASSQSLESTDPLTRLQRNLQRMIPANPEGPAREVSTVPLEQPVLFK